MKYITLTNLLAAYGAITGVVQLLNAATNLRKNLIGDRADIKISHKRETEETECDGQIYAGEEFTVVTVRNKGRRPVHITRLQAQRLFPNGPLVLDCAPELGHTLIEGGTPVTACFDDERLSLDEVQSFEAYESEERVGVKHVARFHHRAWSSLRRRMHDTFHKLQIWWWMRRMKQK
jgi:hypothetical protein